MERMGGRAGVKGGLPIHKQHKHTITRTNTHKHTKATQTTPPHTHKARKRKTKQSTNQKESLQVAIREDPRRSSASLRRLPLLGRGARGMRVRRVVLVLRPASVACVLRTAGGRRSREALRRNSGGGHGRAGVRRCRHLR